MGPRCCGVTHADGIRENPVELRVDPPIKAS